MSDLQAITPSDTNPLAQPVRGLFVGVAGDIALWTVNDGIAAAVTFKAVPVGPFVVGPPGAAISIAGVKATGTTATNLLGVASK